MCIAQQYRSNSLPRKWLWFHFRWVAKLLEHKMNARTTTVCDLTKALEKRCLWYTQKTIEQVWNEAHKGHIYIYIDCMMNGMYSLFWLSNLRLLIQSLFWCWILWGQSIKTVSCIKNIWIWGINFSFGTPVTIWVNN